MSYKHNFVFHLSYVMLFSSIKSVCISTKGTILYAKV